MNNVIDIHIHINPLDMLTPQALAAFGLHHADFDAIREMIESPKKFLEYLDRTGVEKAALINYVSPDVMGYTVETNDWIARYARTAPERLIACGSVHPRFTTDCAAEVDRIANLGIKMLKVHPPHQLIYPNQYRTNLPQQAQIYQRAQDLGLPVMIHTGTSMFPQARNIYAQPIHIDDLIVDFPKLRIIVAHGGRPLWMNEAFFLVRRSKNIFLDISSIPPRSLLEYFPRLEEISNQVLFGSDWPGPGVRDVGANIAAFQALPLNEETKIKILRENALKLFSL